MSPNRRVLLVLTLLVAGCGDDTAGPDGEPDYGPCLGGFFTASPVTVADLVSIAPLGNLNPPGHTFPTGHMYFYLRSEPGAGRTVTTPLRSPGAMTVSHIRAIQHVNAGIVDFDLTLRPCNDITVVFGHVTSLAESLFGDTSSFDTWEFRGEYSTGGETYRSYERQAQLGVTAGTRLGTAGGNPGQWALDFGVYDTRAASTAANPARWINSRYREAVCALEYYGNSAVRSQLDALLDREPVLSDPHPCGQALQDVPGTAHGCWFREGVAATYPEDFHLALVWSSSHPSQAVFSVGVTVATLASGTYALQPQGSGMLNRPFTTIVPDGHTYGCTAAGVSGVILLSMPDAHTLWIERSPGGTSDPGTWAFTDSRSVFIR